MAELTTKQEAAYENVIAAATSSMVNEALAVFDKLLPTSGHKRAEVADAIIDKLNTSADLPAKKLSRLLMLLAAIDTPNAAQRMEDYTKTDPDRNDDRVQVWALVSLVKMSAHQNTYSVLKGLSEQEISNNRIHALVLRLLVQCSGDDPEESQRYIDRLRTFYQTGNADRKWAVFRALRSVTDLDALPPDPERTFLTELVAPALHDDFEWLDVRLQAVQVCGDVQHHLADAMRQLSAAFQSSSSVAILRRYCVDAMREVAQRMDKAERESSQFADCMIVALEDESADVRSRAQAALREIYRSQGAVDLITDFLVQQEEPSDNFVEALRHIDEARASEALRSKLFHLDPDIVNRASDALTQLGGEQAFRTLFAQKRQVIDQYTEILNDADEKIMAQFDLLMRQARLAFWISMVMHCLVFLMGISIFVIALSGMSGGGDDPTALIRGFIGVAGGTAGVILGLFYKSPVNNIGKSVTRLVKINVAFLGYMRQINQIDATFKQLFLDMSAFSLAEMQETVNQIRVVVDQSLLNIQNYLVVGDAPDGQELQEPTEGRA